MIWENFKPFFHESWHKKMQSFVESEECDRIYAFLKKEGRRGKKIAPLSFDTWRCFKETSYDELKVAIFGLSPYHTFRKGLPVADGLLMSCVNGGKLQPSLEKFYEAIERELYDGLHLTYEKTLDTSYLARQGVLMGNISLTCEMNKAGSHIALWEPFMKYLLEEVLFGTGVPIVFLGKEAGKYEKYVPPFTWHFTVSHPANSSYMNVDWETDGLFRKINKILKDSNGYEIQWLKTI